jgi:putative membrane protein
MSVLDLPAVNAALNGLAAILLVVGWIFIKQKKVSAHKACMVAAFVTSALFLACYLTHQYYRVSLTGESSTPFPGKGIWRGIYYSILIPHIILAMVMLPFILRVFYLAFRGDFVRHRRLARITLPVWIYVSVTGVLVYVMLYRISWDAVE